MKNRISYCFYLLLLAIVYLMSDSLYADFAMGTTILMAVCSIVELAYVTRGIRGRIQLYENAITRGDYVRIGVVFENESKLPVNNMEVEISYRDSNHGKYKTMKLYGVVLAQGSVCLEGYLKTEHCGYVDIRVNYVRVWDLFHVFSWKKACAFPQKSMYILPWTNIPMTDVLAQAGDFAGKYGEDVYETYDVREYQDGDDMRQIHWKLTAKMDLLLVREYLKTSESGVMIALDLNQSKKYSRGEYDVFLDRVSSLSWEILKWGVSHYVTWQQGEQKAMLYIESEEDFIEYQMLLIQNLICERELEAYDLFEKIVDREKIHTIVIGLDGKIYWEEGKDS